MIKSNKFYIQKLEAIVFIGFSEVISNLIEINQKLRLKTDIISSSDQSKKLKVKHIVFDKTDKMFINYIKNNFNINNTLFISLGSRIIFNKQIIKLLNNNLINFHGTRLPYDSGGGGFSWAILREDRLDNQLVHLVDDGIDTGPVIDNKLSIFPSYCKIPMDFENYHLERFIDFYKNFIRSIISGEVFELKPQPKYIGRYNPRLSTKDNAYINWSYKPHDLINFINAFDNPYPGAMTFLNRGNLGELKIKSAHLHGGDSSHHPYMTGIVSRHDKDWIVVSTVGKYSLLIEQIINIDGENIINRIIPGDRFYTPLKYIDESLNSRVIYTSLGKK